MGNAKPNRRELERRRKIRKFWRDPENRKAQSSRSKQLWTPESRAAKSQEQKRFWADRPERRKVQSRKMERIMRDPERRETNSENMKRLHADPKFEALRLSGIAKAEDDPELKARRRATLEATLAAPGVRKRAILNSKKAQSDPEYRARASAKGKKLWADLRAARERPPKSAMPRKRGPDPSPFTETTRPRMGEAVEKEIMKTGDRSRRGIVAARYAVAGQFGLSYDTIKEYHRDTVRWQMENPA